MAYSRESLLGIIHSMEPICTACRKSILTPEDFVVADASVASHCEKFFHKNCAFFLEHPTLNEHGPVVLTNATHHALHVTAVVETNHISVAINESTPGKLERELTETKAVLGDLLQEKLSGTKVYTVHQQYPTEDREGALSGSELLHHVHLSLESAKKLVEGRTGRTHNWEKHDSHGKVWMGNRYYIEEHEIL